MSLNGAGEEIAQILSRMRLNAAAFIVTVYGDIAVPRGGVLWTGTLIELCGSAGINESLVRTAVSRLVAAERLTGERIGRRSYYRLAEAARAEFQQAADLLYGPDQPGRGWQVIHAPDLSPDDARRLRLGAYGRAGVHPPGPWPDAAAGRACAACGRGCGACKARRFLGSFRSAGGLCGVHRQFSPLLAVADEGGCRLADGDALTARLLLVHAYRHVLLRDPRLPQAALPAGWNGGEARHLFRRLYLALTPGTERHVAAHLEGTDGFLPACTPESISRIPVAV
ncbi:PaaX family transcriptional regulator C-terminal domain-containing protein [Pannonibacter sp. Pt2-lr]